MNSLFAGQSLSYRFAAVKFFNGRARKVSSDLVSYNHQPLTGILPSNKKITFLIIIFSRLVQKINVHKFENFLIRYLRVLNSKLSNELINHICKKCICFSDQKKHWVFCIGKSKKRLWQAQKCYDPRKIIILKLHFFFLAKNKRRKSKHEPLYSFIQKYSGSPSSFKQGPTKPKLLIQTCFSGRK